MHGHVLRVMRGDRFAYKIGLGGFALVCVDTRSVVMVLLVAVPWHEKCQAAT
jgi:hypothetical protein